MLIKNFYCPYCNRVYLPVGRKSKIKNRDHFIPKSIGGKETIPVCRKCNAIANINADLKTVALCNIYNFHLGKPFHVIGSMTLWDGSILPGSFLLTDYSKGGLLRAFCTESKKIIPTNQVKEILFFPLDQKHLLECDPGISKILLGGLYYLFQRNQIWKIPEIQREFKGLMFADLRGRFLERDFNPGASGPGRGFTLSSLLNDEAELILNEEGTPHLRKHIIKIVPHKDKLEIVLVLFSEIFWRCDLPGNGLAFSAMRTSWALPSLPPINPKRAANHMHNQKHQIGMRF